MVTSWPKSRSYSLTWAMKMAATASYRAVPSMLMVAPTGKTKRAICRSTPQFSRRHFMVIGNVAELHPEQGEKNHIDPRELDRTKNAINLKTSALINR